MNEKLRIIYFGTPEFAVPPLDILIKNGYHIVGVVTTSDKPAGRGLEIKMSAVKQYARSKNLQVLQPENLKSEEFLSQLKELKPNLGIVVAFRKLPREAWSIPGFGTFNLHASLLPHYRGAAPVNWAIINGEKESGVTTFFLNDGIDTGKIIFRTKENIREDDCAGDLYERLMKNGADLVLKTVRAIESGTYTPEEQSSYVKPGEKLKPAPKIFKNDCKINWEKSANNIYNFIRGLSPYPAAWTHLKDSHNQVVSLKIFKTMKEESEHGWAAGHVLYSNNRNLAKVAVQSGFIHLLEVQLEGRKKMHIEEFLRGFSFDEWKIVL